MVSMYLDSNIGTPNVLVLCNLVSHRIRYIQEQNYVNSNLWKGKKLNWCIKILKLVRFKVVLFEGTYWICIYLNNKKCERKFDTRTVKKFRWKEFFPKVGVNQLNDKMTDYEELKLCNAWNICLLSHFQKNQIQFNGKT
jgi:hypothetical protein